MKGRVILIITLIALLFSAVFFTVPVSAEEAQPLFSTRNLLRTSNDSENYSIIMTEGDSISVKGKYRDAHSIKLKVLCNAEPSGYSFRNSGDGSFEAEITVKPPKNSGYLLLITLNGEIEKRCNIQYNNGWCFVDNRIEDDNLEALGNIFEAEDEACCLYLDADGDPERIEFVREQLRLIAKDVTSGIEDDLEKARALEKYVSENFCYDHDAKATSVSLDSIALDTVLRDRRSVCMGISNLYAALLEASGIKAVNIKGASVYQETPYTLPTEGQNHEWTAFFYEKENRWVWVDPVWDGLGDYKKGEYIYGKYHGTYFDITDFAFSINHRADKAERRAYFDTEIPESFYTEESETEAPKTETAAEETTVTTAETTAPEVKEQLESQVSELMESAYGGEDNTPLIVAAIILVVGIAALIAVIIKLFKNGRKTKMVVIELENGKEIKIELYPDIAPITVENFEKLVNKGFYDGLTFHRVISGFMIQGGCPIGNGTGNSGEHIKGEFLANGVVNNLKHTRGVISMARAADPNSASCQFFIMHEDAPHLDGSYAAFGKVIEGMEAVDEIAGCETDYADKPVTPVVMKSVKITD